IEESGPKNHFYPRQAFRDVLAIFFSATILFLAAAFVDAPIERMADPVDTAYVPRPDWYFLFLFQILKLFRGSLESIGSIGVPTAAVIALFAVPFVDRGALCRVRRRVTAIGIVILFFAGWGALTLGAIANAPRRASLAALPGSALQTTPFSPDELAGIGLFRSARCETCHNLVDGVPKEGPNLAGADLEKPREWRIVHFNHAAHGVKSTATGVSRLSLTQLNVLSVLLARLTPQRGRDLEQVPQRLVKGAEVYASHACGSCHRVNGTGGEIGPPLNGLVARRDHDWIVRHFGDPQALSPGSVMPPYHFSTGEEEALLSYLLALPE
ncbi:MAG: c-type cytochrome, partial [Bryobacteraceae bacterium]